MAGIALCLLSFAAEGVNKYKSLGHLDTHLLAASEGAHLPFATTNTFAYFPLWWYSNDTERAQMTLLYDPHAPMGVTTRAAIASAEIFHMRVVSLDSFLADKAPSQATLQSLEAEVAARKAGFQLTPVGNFRERTFDLQPEAQGVAH